MLAKLQLSGGHAYAEIIRRKLSWPFFTARLHALNCLAGGRSRLLLLPWWHGFPGRLQRTYGFTKNSVREESHRLDVCPELIWFFCPFPPHHCQRKISVSMSPWSKIMPSLSPEQAQYMKDHIDDTKVPGLIAVGCSCLALSYIFVCLRFISRRIGKVKLAANDWLIVLALVNDSFAKIWPICWYVAVFSYNRCSCLSCGSSIQIGKACHCSHKSKGLDHSTYRISRRIGSQPNVTKMYADIGSI